MTRIKEDEVIAFDMYFASISSMQYHPGAGTKEHVRLTVPQCKDYALEMIRERRKALEVS